MFCVGQLLSITEDCAIAEAAFQRQATVSTKGVIEASFQEVNLYGKPA
jgi:hypothetical protein